MFVFVCVCASFIESLLSEELEEDDEAFSTRSTMLGPSAAVEPWSAAWVLLLVPPLEVMLGAPPFFPTASENTNTRNCEKNSTNLVVSLNF